MRKTTTMLLTLLLTVACATHSIAPDSSAPDSIVPGDVSSPQEWGGATNVTQLKYLYFSEQPDAETLKIAKSRGVTTVVSLRDPGESDWNEREAVEQNGLRFVNIPIKKQADGLDSNAIAAIGALVKMQEGQPILLHCSSGNRAAAWLATHLVDDHGMDIEKALAVARKAGLNKDDMEKRVRTYLGNP